ncbi:hypothetical protein D3C72_2465020 [compost metagenome]
MKSYFVAFVVVLIGLVFVVVVWEPLGVLDVVGFSMPTPVSDRVCGLLLFVINSP